MNRPSEITFTRFNSPNTLVKSYSLADDGTLKKTPPAKVGSGVAEKITCLPDQLPELLQSLTPQQCLIHGNTGKESVKIVKDENRKPGETSRTKKFFSYPTGPGMGMFDHDSGKGWTGGPDALAFLICTIFPAFAAAATVTKFSASANIYAGNTLLSTPSPNYHLYFFPQDASDLPRFGKLIFDRLTLAGYCHGEVSKSGAVLKRGPIDAVVFSPERVDYSGPAIMGAGLHQLREAPVYSPGGFVDTSLLSDLTPDEKEQKAKFWEGVYLRLEPERKRKTKEHIDSEVKRTGESRTVVEKRVHARNQYQIISPDTITSGGRLGDVPGGSYIENPIEPSNAKARVYQDEYGKTLHSFRHDGQQYAICRWQRVRLEGLHHGKTDKTEKAIFAQINKAQTAKEAAASALAYCLKSLHKTPYAITPDGIIKKLMKAAPLVLHPLTLKALHSLCQTDMETARERFYSCIQLCDETKKANIYAPIQKLTDIPASEYQRPGIIAVRAPMGSGKTQICAVSFAQTAAASGSRFVAGCHRRSLTSELFNRLKDHYPHLFDYREDWEICRAAQGVTCCINSLTVKRLAHVVDKCGYLFIDEIAQVLNHIALGSFRDDAERVAVFRKLKEIVARARTVLVCDAHLNDDVIAFLNECRPGEQIRIFEMEADFSNLHINFLAGEKAMNAAPLEILTRQDAGERTILAVDSAKRVTALDSYLRQHSDRRILSLHAGNKGNAAVKKFIDSPDAVAQDYDCIIHSPVISSGISLQDTKFDYGLGHFFGVDTPMAALQMLRRARSVTEWTVVVASRRLEKLSNEEAVNTVVVAKNETAEEDLSDWDLFYARQLATDNRSKNDFTRNMFFLLEYEGYRITSPSTEGGASKDYLQDDRRKEMTERIEGILSAADISEEEYTESKRQEDPTAADLNEITRHEIQETVKRQDITEEDVILYGSQLKQFHRHQLFAGYLDGSQDDTADAEFSLRRCDRLAAAEYKRWREAAGLEDILKGGTYTEENANRFLDAVLLHPERAVGLGIVPQSLLKCGKFSFTVKRPARPVNFLGEVLRLAGYETHAVGQVGKRGNQKRKYALQEERIAFLNETSERIKKASRTQYLQLYPYEEYPVLCTKSPEGEEQNTGGIQTETAQRMQSEAQEVLPVKGSDEGAAVPTRNRNEFTEYDWKNNGAHEETPAERISRKWLEQEELEEMTMERRPVA